MYYYCDWEAQKNLVHLKEEEEMAESVEHLEKEEMIQMLMEAFLLARSQNLVPLSKFNFHFLLFLRFSQFIGETSGV